MKKLNFQEIKRINLKRKKHILLFLKLFLFFMLAQKFNFFINKILSTPLRIKNEIKIPRRKMLPGNNFVYELSVVPSVIRLIRLKFCNSNFSIFGLKLILYFSKKDSACMVKLTGKRNPDDTYTYKKNTAIHTHIIDIRDAEAKARYDSAKRNATISNKSTRELYSDAVAGVAAEVLGEMQSQLAFSKSMRKQCKGTHPKSPMSLDDLILPTVKTAADEEFVMFDSGQKKIVSLCFRLNFLNRCETLHMDGTISSGPMLFDQLYTIHG